MSEEAILLKIKRDFTHDEAVGILNKQLSVAKFRIGELESEISELYFLLNKPGEGKTAKQWKQDDFFNELKQQLTRAMLKKRDLKKDMELWRNRYFSLVAKVMKVSPELLSSEPDVQVSDTTDDASSNVAGSIKTTQGGD